MRIVFGGGLIGKGWHLGWLIFWSRVSGFLADSSYEFYFTVLIWLTVYVQTERCCINCYCPLIFLAYFVLLKVFLVVIYFINNLFKFKSVYELTQVSIKISKISYFSFSFKLNEKKKVALKNVVWKGKLQREVGWSLTEGEGVGRILKKGGAWQGRCGEKIEG